MKENGIEWRRIKEKNGDWKKSEKFKSVEKNEDLKNSEKKVK